MLPGLKFSTRTSASSSSRSSTSLPAGFERSRPTPFLLRLIADEVAGIARLVEWRAPFARLVALRRLQLDHLGAVVGQYHRAVRASEHAREIDHFEPSQRAGASRQGFAPGQRRKIVHGALFLPNTRAASASLSSISSQTAPRNSASRSRSTPLLPPPAAPGSPEPSRILGHYRLAGLAIAALRELASRQGGRADREIRLTLRRRRIRVRWGRYRARRRNSEFRRQSSVKALACGNRLKWQRRSLTQEPERQTAYR